MARDISLRIAIENAAKAQQDLRAFGESGEAALARLNKSAASTASPLATVQKNIGGIGLQLQDVAVSLQGGQNPFVVLSQQGSQVASLFGPAGAVAGALLAFSSIAAGSLFSFTREAQASADLLDGALSAAFDGAGADAERYADRLAKATGAQKEFLAQTARLSLQGAAIEAGDLVGQLDVGALAKSRAGKLDFQGPGAPGQRQFAEISAKADIRRDVLDAVKAGDVARLQSLIATGDLGATTAAGNEAAQRLLELAGEVQLAKLVEQADEAGLRALAPIEDRKAPRRPASASRRRDNASAAVEALKQQVAAQGALAAAYGRGAEAVAAFNIEQQILAAQRAAGVDAASAEGREIAALVERLDEETKAAEGARLAQERLARVREQENRRLEDRGFDPIAAQREFRLAEQARAAELDRAAQAFADTAVTPMVRGAADLGEDLRAFFG